MDELRKAVAFRDFLKVLNSHVTRTLYDEGRANVLQLISRKISRKEYLIKQQDEAFTDALNKQITSVESEISTMIAFVQAFDRMAEYLADETAKAVDESYQITRLNAVLNTMLDAETERAGAWSDAAFKLAGDYLKFQINPSHFANA